MANAYEEERARRVAQNRARLEELMLKDLARAMAAEGRAAAGGAGGASKAVKAERAEAARKRRAERAAAAPERKSRRVSENPALQVKYNQTDYADITGQVWRRRGGGGAESGRSRALRLAHAGADVWPPRDAVVDAMCAADDVVAKLKPMRAWVKVMSPSQVSGGFWMQLPKESHATFASYAKETIFLQAVETDAELGQSIREANGKSRENDPSDARWPVVLLPRPKGAAGLSGGWRGFSLDHRLSTGDVVVFALQERNVLQAHIVRHRGLRLDAVALEERADGAKSKADAASTGPMAKAESGAGASNKKSAPVGKEKGKGKPRATPEDCEWGAECVGRRVEALWDAYGVYFPGTLESFNDDTQEFRIRYDDGEYEDVTLPDPTVRLL